MQATREGGREGQKNYATESLGRSRRGRGALPPFNYRNDGFLFASKTIGNSAHDAQNKQERERGGTVSLNVWQDKDWRVYEKPNT